MLKDIRKGLMTGLGAIFMTRERIEEVTQRLVKEAKLSEEDARRLVDELSDSGEEQFARIEKSISEAMSKGMDSIGVSRQEAFENLKEKVDAMEIRVSILERAREAEKER